MAYSATEPASPTSRYAAAWMFCLCIVACTDPQIVYEDFGPTAARKAPTDGGAAPVTPVPRHVPDDRCGDAGCLSCDRTQECDEGELCQDHRCVPDPYCGDGRRDEGEACDDGNDSDTDVCVGCRLAFCGDGKIRKGHEECEIGAQGWTSKSCDLRTCKRRDYLPCNGGWYCPNQNACDQGVCAPIVCPSRGCNAYPNTCPGVPGFESRIVGDRCFIACSANRACPKGLICSENQLCIGPSEDAVESFE